MKNFSNFLCMLLWSGVLFAQEQEEYFAQAYGLKQVSIEIEGKEPKPADLRELIEHARADGIKFVFVQPQFSARSAKLIAREISGQVVFADPLAEDWAGNLRAVARKFKSALR